MSLFGCIGMYLMYSDFHVYLYVFNCIYNDLNVFICNCMYSHVFRFIWTHLNNFRCMCMYLNYFRCISIQIYLLGCMYVFLHEFECVFVFECFWRCFYVFRCFVCNRNNLNVFLYIMMCLGVLVVSGCICMYFKVSNVFECMRMYLNASGCI